MSAAEACGADTHEGMGSVWGEVCALADAAETSRSAIKIAIGEIAREKRKALVIDSGSVSESSRWKKRPVADGNRPRDLWGLRCIKRRSVLAWGMDKKEINSPKMTLNFLIWIGGVFMLLLFALLAHFVWRLF